MKKMINPIKKGTDVGRRGRPRGNLNPIAEISLPGFCVDFARVCAIARCSFAFNNSDFEWATKWEHFCSASCKLYIQPEWDKREKMTPAIIDFVKENPHWQISLQTHKIINVP